MTRASRKDVRLGWLPDSPDHRDKVFNHPLLPADLPSAVDLTNDYAVPVVDQGQLGSCTGNGIASALAYLQLREGEPLVYPSRLFIYYNERVIEGTTGSDAGAEIRDGIKAVVSQGYCPETDWPYIITKFADKPSNQSYTDAAKDLVQKYERVNVDPTSLMSALAAGYPVVVGFTVYDSFFNDVNGDIPMPNLNEGVQGGHCVLVVGYSQITRRFKFQNSWGTGWGSNGFGTLPYEYLGSTIYGGDYWIITGDESQAPVPDPVPNPDPTPVPPPPSPTPDPNNKGCLGALRQIINAKNIRAARKIAKAEIAKEGG